jgi:circadian clock protein KaiC
MMNKARIDRLATGVPGFDAVLGGGLPEFSFNLLAGPPGSGKTTLAHQMMFALATPERSALYFTTLGESPLKMLRYQQQFAFFDSDQVNRSIRFISLGDDTAAGDVGSVLGRIGGEVKKYAPALVFIDSFRSLILAGEGAGISSVNLQQFILQLGMLLATWNATTFLIGEYAGGGDSSPIFSVADGLIWLRQTTQRNSIVRKMEIVKMRGQATVPGLHTFRIDVQGLKVFAPTVLSAVAPAPARYLPRLHMGIPGLDEMMGGGLPRGYSLLVAGPSGSGKSILAASFLAEGARAAETGVIAAFEQRPHQARGPVVADLIATGRVGVIDTRTSTLSVDEIATLLIAEVQRLGASRVVIDSLSGFELALAPTFREDFRESLARMLSALANTGVTVLMTSELEDRYYELGFSPYGTAFLTDAIIMQRYVEIDSRLERMIAVVKMRASRHSTQLRLFHIDDEGIKIDEQRGAYAGLLSGAPRRWHKGRRIARPPVVTGER